MLNPNSQMMPKSDQNFPNTTKKLPNPANYKIVKCKNFEKDGVCKYGNTCTFAHGDNEIRSKVENQYLGNQGNPNQNSQMMPNMMNQYAAMDPLFMGMGGMQMNPGKIFFIFIILKNVL